MKLVIKWRIAYRIYRIFGYGRSVSAVRAVVSALRRPERINIDAHVLESYR